MELKHEAQAAETPGRLQRLMKALAEAILVAKPTRPEVISRSAASDPACEAMWLDLDVTRGFTPAVYGLDSFRHPSADWHRGDLAVYQRYQNGWGKAEFEDAPSLPRRNGFATAVDIDALWLDAA